MYRIAICDDHAEDGEALCSLMHDYFEEEGLEYEVVPYNDAQSLLDVLASGLRYDIYFLDIVMPCIDGMELARTIREGDNACAIVFITVSPDYAIQGYKVRALDYIVKPIKKSELEIVLACVIARFSRIGTIVIKIREKTGFKELNTSQIICAESRRHSLIFNMLDGSTQSVIARLDEYAPLLTRYSFFLRCHKSYIVNLNYVKELDNNCFVLVNGKILGISRSYQTICKNRYYRFILDKVKGGPA